MRAPVTIISALVLSSMIGLTGCKSAESKTSKAAPGNNPSNAQSAPTGDDVRRISIAEAKAEFESGKAVIVDVRGEAVYKLGHIKGSKLIAMNEMVARSSELPKDKTIILYCSCPSEQSSVAAAQMLKAKNIENTAALVGGYPAWQAAGYPVEEAK